MVWLAGAAPGLLGLALATGCSAKAASVPSGAFQGIVELDERVLGFEVGGRIDSLEVDRGDAVRAGQLLASLDDTLKRAELAARVQDAAAARAQLELLVAGTREEDIRAMAARVRAARADEVLQARELTRRRYLLAEDVYPQATVDPYEARWRAARAQRQSLAQKLEALRKGARPEQLKAARAKLAAANEAVRLTREQLDRHRLRALAGGAVLERHVEPGEVVASGSPVFTVADTSHPYADVFVPQGKLDGIVVNAAATLHVDATEQSFSGHVEDVAQRTEFTPRFLFSKQERPNLVVRVRVRIDDPAHRLHAGVPAFVNIQRRRYERRAH